MRFERIFLKIFSAAGLAAKETQELPLACWRTKGSRMSKIFSC